MLVLTGCLQFLVRTQLPLFYYMQFWWEKIHFITCEKVQCQFGGKGGLTLVKCISATMKNETALKKALHQDSLHLTHEENCNAILILYYKAQTNCNIYLREKQRFLFSRERNQNFTRELAPSPYQMHIFILDTHGDYLSD